MNKRASLFNKRNVSRLLLFGLLGWLIFTIVRSWLLLSNGRRIAENSETFKRDYYLGNKNAPVFTYLVMGDITAAGWGAAQLSGTYPHRIAAAVAERGYYIHVVNVAVGGATLHDVVEKQLPSLKQTPPDLITFSFGANDATHFTSQSDYSHDLRTLISALKNSDAKRILIATTPDMYQAPALALPLSIAINLHARRLNNIFNKALQGSEIQSIDLYNEGKLIYREEKDLYAADLFHPSSKGYGRWASLFIQKLEGL